MKNEIKYVILEKNNIRKVKYYNNKIDLFFIKIYYKIKKYKIY